MEDGSNRGKKKKKRVGKQAHDKNQIIRTTSSRKYQSPNIISIISITTSRTPILYPFFHPLFLFPLLSPPCLSPLAIPPFASPWKNNFQKNINKIGQLYFPLKKIYSYPVLYVQTFYAEVYLKFACTTVQSSVSRVINVVNCIKLKGRESVRRKKTGRCMMGIVKRIV